MPLRLWSKQIAKILHEYIKDSTLLLFAMTGDIDNLGLYVARNGRPLAENLVDVYNRITGEFILKYHYQNSETLPHMCMIPSGEEIFVIGVVTEESRAEHLFATVDHKLNKYIESHSAMWDEAVTISFGHSILLEIDFHNDIAKFIELVNDMRISEANASYLSVMLGIRERLAYSLDSSKFRSLDARQLGLVKLYRNIVYAHMKEYKKATRMHLVKVAERAHEDPEFLRYLKNHNLNDIYGISEIDADELLGL